MASGIVVWFGFVLTGAAALTLVFRGTLDLDSNGIVDAIQFNFSAAVNDNQVDAAVRARSFAIVGYYFDLTQGWHTGAMANDTGGYIAVIEANNEYNTGITPQTLYTSVAGAPITGLVSDTSYVVASDTAPPVLTSVFYTNDNSNSDFALSLLVSESFQYDPDTDQNTNFNLVSNVPGCLVASPVFNNWDSSGPPASKFLQLFTSQVLTVPCANQTLSVRSDRVFLDLASPPNNLLVGSFALNTSGFNAANLDRIVLTQVAFTDADGNGYIDTVRVQSADAFQDNTFAYAPPSVLSSTPSLPQVAYASGTATCTGDLAVVAYDPYWCVHLVETPQGFNTGLTGTYAIETDPYPGSGLWGFVSSRGSGFGTHAYGRMVNYTGVVVDRAAPLMWFVRGFDTRSNGVIDTVQIVFTEPILQSTTQSSDWSATANGVAGPVVLLTRATIWFDLTNSTLMLAVSPVLPNTQAPVITYLPYYPLFTDVPGNAMVRPTVLVPPTQTIRAALGRVGSTVLQLQFSQNASDVLLSNLSLHDPQINQVLVSILAVDAQTVDVSLSLPLDPSEVGVAYVTYGGVSVLVRDQQTAWYMNRGNQTVAVLDGPLLPSQVNTVRLGIGWFGYINLMAIVPGELSVHDMSAMLTYCTDRVRNQFYANPCLPNPCGASACIRTSPTVFQCSP